MSATMPYWRVLLYPFRGGAAIESINVAKMIPLDADGAAIGGSPTITGEQVYDDGSYPLSDTQTDVGTEYCVFDWQSGETAPAAIKFQFSLPTAVDAFKVYFNSTDTVVGTRLASDRIYLLVQHSWDGTSWTTSGVIGNAIALGNTNYEIYAHRQAILYAAGFDVPYSGPGGIYGVVSEDGAAAPGYPVVALQRDTFDKVAYTTTDEYGGYNLQGLNPDREYAVMAFDPTGVSPKNALIWDRVKPISAYASFAPENAFIAQRFRDPMLGPTLAIAGAYPQYVGLGQYSEGFVQHAFGLGGLTGASSSLSFDSPASRVTSGTQEQDIGILQAATVPGLAHLCRTDFVSPRTPGNFFILFGGYHPDCPITQPIDYAPNTRELTFELILVPPASASGLVVEIGGGWTTSAYLNWANDYAVALWSYYSPASAGPTRAMAFEFTSSQLKIHAHLGAYNAATVLATAAYAAGVEHHVAITYQEGVELNVYIDGSLAATANLSGLGRLWLGGVGTNNSGYSTSAHELVNVADYSNAGEYSATPTGIYSVSVGPMSAVRSVNFRSFNHGIQDAQYRYHRPSFDGAVAWFATFFGAKDATAIAALYDSYSNPTTYQVPPTQVGYSAQVEADNPSMYFPFSGTTWNGDKLLRSTLGRKDLGLAPIYGAPLLGQSAAFVGGKTALRLNGASGLLLRGGGALLGQVFSIEMFLAPSSLSATATLIDVVNPTATNRLFEIALNTSGDLVLGIYPAVAPGTIRTLTTPGGTCPVATATHVVLTYDPLDSGLVTVYKNGVQVVQSVATQVHAANLAYGMFIGARSGNTQRFNGLMGELAIYGYELSAARVAAHYAAISS